ncbi:type IA DNA topoisomerase [Pseudomonas reactans]|uniref:type IA DNA topoisomerase n=1 Tax=Pseudomonas reactans TaxID=117680 RepID=UPI0015A1C6B7|nr:type IA DNA topoisomerase [Pseudomonas reactans]NWC90004.1 topoisomerase C-terminal repeat-containing protein [Pseudomonas reactans]
MASDQKILLVGEKKTLIEAVLNVLPGRNDEDARTHIIRGNYHCVWLTGHAYEQAMPDHYLPDDLPKTSKGNKVWRSQDLPIIPHQWVLVPKDARRPTLAKLKEFLKVCDVIYHIGDPDQEGQLLVDEALQFHGVDVFRTTNPIQRVLINDYNRSKVEQALANLRNNHEEMFQGWHRWALARGRYDWLLGLNATRAMTLRGRELGYDATLPVGSVQTPLQFIMREQERKIESFVPQTYFKLKAQIQHANGLFAARWKPAEGQEGIVDGRLMDADRAKDIAERVKDKFAAIELYQVEPKDQQPPLPLAMDELQMEAFSLYGHTGSQVMEAAQQLYEAYKVATYPRSDVRYLSEAQHQGAPEIIESVLDIRPDLAHLRDKIDPARKSGAFDDKKMVNSKGEPTPHHGIVPTIPENPVTPSQWTEIERNVYDLIVRSYLAQFAGPYQYLKTNIEVLVEGEVFAASGSTPVEAGWKDVFTTADDAEPSDDADDDDKQMLPTMAEGDSAYCKGCEAKAAKTSPPPYFDDRLLIAAMKNVHKYVSDPVSRARLKEGDGIGTTATRAPMIKEMKDRQVIIPLKAGSRKLRTSDQTRAVIDALPLEVKDPAQAGVFKSMLDQVATGEVSLDKFMSYTVDFVQSIVQLAATAEMKLPIKPSSVKSPCPRCKAALDEDRKTIFCKSCDFKLWLEVAGRALKPAEIDTLLQGKETALLSGFSSTKTPKSKFSAKLKLNIELGKVEFLFEPRDVPAQDGPVTAMAVQCPKCQGVFEDRTEAYACVTPKCLQIRKVIASRKIQVAEAEMLLTQKKTGLLTGFRASKPPKREFSAHLVLDVAAGKVEFEFPPRK